MGLLKDERQVSKDTGVDYSTRARADLQYFFGSPDSPFFCDVCKKKLGVWHILRYALFKKPGEAYLVPCKGCGVDNKRFKGAVKEGFDDRWKT
jgi:hypothetical protein